MLGTENLLADRKQGLELDPGRRRVPRLPGPEGELVTGGKGMRVHWTLDPLNDRQQGCVLVPGGGYATGLSGPVGEVGASGQSVRCSAPRTRSRTASRAVSWSRA
jgi:hypothetical protein